MRCLSFLSTPVGVDSAPVGGGGATRAVRPSSPNGLPTRTRNSSAGSRRRAGARATIPASLMAVSVRTSCLSRGRAPRPRAAASAEAPASPTYPPRAQLLRQPLHAVEARCAGAGCAIACCALAEPTQAGCAVAEAQLLERWQHRAQRAKQRQVGRGEALVDPIAPLRLAQLLAAPHPHLEAQRCGYLILSPQLQQQRLRQLPQLVVGAAQEHGEARLEHVAQLAEDDALLVTAELRERHRDARRRARWRGYNVETGEKNRAAGPGSPSGNHLAEKTRNFPALYTRMEHLGVAVHLELLFSLRHRSCCGDVCSRAHSP
eukprot:scaffold14290_cov63-Phaeocystis_antarctica.AAC.6